MPRDTITADLLRRVESGEWQPGEQLPSVSDLAEHYGVSRTTVLKAIKALVDGGLLVTRKRWGTFMPDGT